MHITIARLERPIHEGDWHDKPSVWGVYGPGSEIQRFSRKVDATEYKRCRKASSSLVEACRRYTGGSK
jgi:hypothetical protein